MTLVDVDGVDVHYGDLQVLWDVSLEVREEDSVVSVVGPNGAGKSTLLKTLSGVLSPTSGRVEVLGQDVGETQPSDLVESGFIHISEERNLFGDLTVEKNLQMGAFTKRNTFEENRDSVFDMFPSLEERREKKARTLSGGEQQMLAIGRGLMAEPEVLAFDEPSNALAPQLARQVFETIEEISSDVTVILIEQHVDEALGLADRGYLLENGRIVSEGTGEELLESDAIREGYLRG